MKTLFLSLAFVMALPLHAAPSASPTTGETENYDDFIKQCVKKENVAECIALMDRLVAAGEHGLTDQEPDQGMVEANTSFGLRIEFSATDAKEAIIYYLRISRGGKPLRYADAINFVALFTDRAGLPHPIEVVEGDRSTFFAQWLIKPSSWKAMLKMMTKVRTENRSITDPEKAFLVAINREKEARSATLNQSRE